MKLSHWRYFVIGCLLLGGVVLSAALNSRQSFALGQPAPLPPDGAVCPLSPTQEKESIQAFGALMPTFQDPRCINCHGAVDPFVDNGGHLGGLMKIEYVSVDEFDYDTRQIVKVSRPKEDPFPQCQNCHSNLADWRIPPAELFFVGKDAPTLCQQMKFQFSDADRFIAHLHHDRSENNTQFIAEAFKGTRALDDNGQATYLNATGKDYKPEPPPISREQFVELGKAWIKAMGGEFKGGDTCGCKPHRYALKIGADLGLVFSDPELKGKFDSHEDLKIPITFADDGSFSGQTSADRTMAGSLTVITPLGSVGCTATYAVKQEVWKVEGSRTDSSGPFDVKLTNTWPNPSQTNVVCPGAGGAAMPVPPFGAGAPVSFRMPDYLDGGPGPLDASQAPAVAKFTVTWVDDSVP